MHFQINHLNTEVVAEHNRLLIYSHFNFFYEGIYVMRELLKLIMLAKNSNFQRLLQNTAL